MINAMPRIAIAVHDYYSAVITFRESFGMAVVDLSDETVPSLGAHVGICVPPGGSNIELMSPATASAPLAQSLQRFLDRRGEGLYALMLEAADPNAEAEAIAGRGLDVLPLMEGAGGRDLHPRSTHGVLIRIYPDNSFNDENFHEEREPHLSGITKVIIATDDAHKAASVYGEGLGLTIDEVADDPERGVTVAAVHAPKGGTIELVSPIDSSRGFARHIEDFLAKRGPGMFALVLESDDVRASVATLRSRDIDVAQTESIGAEVSIFSARVLLTQRR